MVTCVDQQVNSVKYIRFQAQKFSMNIKTVKIDAWKFLVKAKANSFDVILNPPYDLDNLLELPNVIFKKDDQKNGWLVIEHGKNINFNDTFNFIEKRTYSSVNFSFLR